MMNEIKDLEKEHAHIDVVLAKERFRSFVFRWRILSKLQKLSAKFDRDSYDYVRAVVEVQEQLKCDIDARVEAVTQNMKERWARVR